MKFKLWIMTVLMTAAAGALSAAGPCPQKLQKNSLPHGSKGKPGDLVISLGTGRLLDLDPDSQAFSMFSTALEGTGRLDGVTVALADTAKLEVCVYSTGLIQEIGPAGALSGTFASIAGQPKMTSFNPADGSLWVPDIRHPFQMFQRHRQPDGPDPERPGDPGEATGGSGLRRRRLPLCHGLPKHPALQRHPFQGGRVHGRFQRLDLEFFTFG
jgi:hypothetical protein